MDVFVGLLKWVLTLVVIFGVGGIWVLATMWMFAKVDERAAEHSQKSDDE